MAYWLLKSEPFKFSFDDMKRVGREPWDGVRNHLAAQNLKAMRVGDLAFFYHSNEGKEIVGIVEIVREAYPDPSDATGKFVMVDVAYKETLKKPVPLAQIKATDSLSTMALVKLSRLSVGPVTSEEWRIILCMAG